MEYRLTPDSMVSTGLMNPAEDKVVPRARSLEGVSALEPLVPRVLRAESSQVAQVFPTVSYTCWKEGLGAWDPSHPFATHHAGGLLLEPPLQAGCVLPQHHVGSQSVSGWPAVSQLCCGVPPPHRRHHHGV